MRVIGMGRRPDALFVLLFQKQGKAAQRPVRYRLCGELNRGLQNLETPCKGAKARAACCPDRGMLSMQWKAPERETGLFFSLVRKEPKVAQRVDPLDSEGRFKTLSIIFFRDISNLRP